MYLTKEISANNKQQGAETFNLNSISRATFSKGERLSDKNITASLFKAGQSFLQHPYTVIYTITELPGISPVQLLISVSKNRFPRAVDRNKIKRQVREAYRKNKAGLYQMLMAENKQLALAIIYSSKKITTFNETENKIKVALSTLIKKISDNG
ncbi:MAG: ribonuclease P protein component [Bacteroidetes bacterium]|nr:ribonuclease P protein component [Bacteroidota bacterium]